MLRPVDSRSGVDDLLEHVRRVGERVIQRRGVGAAALREVGRAAPAAADLRGQSAHHFAGVDGRAVGRRDDERRAVGARADHRDFPLRDEGVGGGAQFVHVAVETLDDGDFVAEVNLLAVARARGAHLGEFLLEVLDGLAPLFPLAEEACGRLGDLLWRDVERVGRVGEGVLGVLGGLDRGVAGRELDANDAVLDALGPQDLDQADVAGAGDVRAAAGLDVVAWPIATAETADAVRDAGVDGLMLDRYDVT